MRTWLHHPLYKATFIEEYEFWNYHDYLVT